MLMCRRALNIPHRATSQRKNFHDAFFAVGKTRHRTRKKLIQVTQESGGLARKIVSLCPSLMPCDPQLKGFTNNRRLRSQSSSLTDALWISHQPFFENQCLAASNTVFPIKGLVALKPLTATGLQSTSVKRKSSLTKYEDSGSSTRP